MNKREVRSPPHPIHKRKQSQRVINNLDTVDFIPWNVKSSHQEAVLYVFEENEAVIKIIIKGRSPTMRHVSRTHKVALDWLFDRISLDPKIQIKYIDTKTQLAEMLTKGNFTRDEWNNLLCLCAISHFSSTNCFELMSKKNAKRFRWRKSHSKVETADEFGLATQRNDSLIVPPSTASESPGKTKHESQFLLISRTEQHQKTGRPVEDAYSSNYTEWNVDKTWSFSSVEIWWIDGSWNMATCFFFRTAHRQIRCWKR